MRKQLWVDLVMILGILFLTGCEHTFKGMKQDIHEDSASLSQNQKKPAKKPQTLNIQTPAPSAQTSAQTSAQ